MWEVGWLFIYVAKRRMRAGSAGNHCHCLAGFVRDLAEGAIGEDEAGEGAAGEGSASASVG
jgi:hypothetical protein